MHGAARPRAGALLRAAFALLVIATVAADDPVSGPPDPALPVLAPFVNGSVLVRYVSAAAASSAAGAAPATTRRVKGPAGLTLQKVPRNETVEDAIARLEQLPGEAVE